MTTALSTDEPAEPSQYVLEEDLVAPEITLSISEERYHELAAARSTLLDALAFEQRYELLLGNFIAMELALTDISLRAAVESRFLRLEAAAESLREANRHVVNVLTATKGYADQVAQDFKALAFGPSFEDSANEELKRCYDNSLAYQFSYELRNHVQHFAEAVHRAEYVGSAHDANGWVEGFRFFADKPKLAANKKFKRRVLTRVPEKIDIRSFVRRTVEAVGGAHFALRAKIRPYIDRARTTFQTAIDEHAQASGLPTVLRARKVGTPAADIPVLLEWDDVRVELVRKNGRPITLWPERTFGEPEPSAIVALREQAQHSVKDAAALVFVSEERWRDYEEGLPMPEGLFELYRLQAALHPTHLLEPKPE